MDNLYGKLGAVEEEKEDGYKAQKDSILPVF